MKTAPVVVEKFPFIEAGRRVIMESMNIKGSLVIACLAPFLSLSAQETVEKVEPLLSLKAGDSWEYQVTIAAPRGAKMPEGKDAEIKQTADGVEATFTKTRIYEGKKVPKEGTTAYDCFRIERASQIEEREFSEVRPDAIYARGWKKEGEKPGAVVLLKKPLLMIAAVNQGGDKWEIKSGDGKTTPKFNRRFRVFGYEKVTVPAGEFNALRVEVTGDSGITEIKRTYWFAKGVGFVKEVKTYYSKTTRLLHQEMVLTKRGKSE